MKRRLGFVSNSSSSSYIVTIEGIDFEEFCDRLSPEYSWSDLFSLDEAKKSLEHFIGKFGRDDTDTWPKSFQSDVKEKLEKLEKIDKDNFKEVVEFILELNRIGCKELKNGIELCDFTSMHNDFDSGMSGIMKEIILYFMFDTKYNIKCERESD